MRGAARQFGEREPALIAVGRAERRAKMLGSYFLEFGEVLAGRGGVATALIRAGQAKFGGGVIREESEGFLESGDGQIVVLKLRIQIADEIPRVGLVDKLRDVRKGFDAFFRVPEILVGEAEVVPGEGIFRKFFRSGGESGASRLELLLGEERDAEVEAGDFELGVGGERFLEEFFGVSRALLIHVGDAERVEPIGFGGVGVRSGFLRRRGLQLSGARMKKGSRDTKDR